MSVQILRGETHLLGIFREHAICCLDHVTLMLGRSLAAGFIDATSSNELVHLGHGVTLNTFFS